MSLSALERLGLEVSAFDLLGSRMTSAMLVCLINGNGSQVGWEKLKTARGWRMPADHEGSTRKSVQVRICLLRNALEDLGFPNVIMTTGHHGRGMAAAGYALPEPGRTAIITRLIEEAQ